MDDENQEHGLHDVFLQFFSADRHRIYRFIYSLVPIEADAEDVFQQTSITLWRKFSDFDQDREFFPWASTTSTQKMGAKNGEQSPTMTTA